MPEHRNEPAPTDRIRLTCLELTKLSRCPFGRLALRSCLLLRHDPPVDTGLEPLTSAYSKLGTRENLE